MVKAVDIHYVISNKSGADGGECRIRLEWLDDDGDPDEFVLSMPQPAAREFFASGLYSTLSGWRLSVLEWISSPELRAELRRSLLDRISR